MANYTQNICVRLSSLCMYYFQITDFFRIFLVSFYKIQPILGGSSALWVHFLTLQMKNYNFAFYQRSLFLYITYNQVTQASDLFTKTQVNIIGSYVFLNLINYHALHNTDFQTKFVQSECGQYYLMPLHRFLHGRTLNKSFTPTQE